MTKQVDWNKPIEFLYDSENDSWIYAKLVFTPPIENRRLIVYLPPNSDWLALWIVESNSNLIRNKLTKVERWVAVVHEKKPYVNYKCSCAYETREDAENWLGNSMEGSIHRLVWEE